MITACQSARLYDHVSGTSYGYGSHGPAGNVLVYLYAIVCDLIDPEDRYIVAEDLVSAAMALRDEIDGEIVAAQANREADRADDRIKEYEGKQQ